MRSCAAAGRYDVRRGAEICKWKVGTLNNMLAGAGAGADNIDENDKYASMF